MIKRRVYFPPEIDVTTFPEETMGNEILFVSEGLESSDYDLEEGIWWS